MEDNTIKRLPLTLNMKIPLQAAAYAALQNIPKGKRTEFVCKKIAAGEQLYELPPVVYNAISDCIQKALREYGPIQAPAAVQPVQQPDEAEKARKNFLGFLSTLEDEGEDDD